MDHRRLLCLPAVRVGSRLHLASVFSRPGGRRRGSAASPPALMADVRVVIRRHFPVGLKGVVVEKVSDDIALRRQPSRKLRTPERVARALAEQVLPFVEHPIDLRAVAIASKQICAYVSAACSDPRLADGGVQVLVLLDTFACPTLLRPAPRDKQSTDLRVVARTCPCLEIDLGSRKPSFARLADSSEHGAFVRTCPCMDTVVRSKKTTSSVGIIGDGRRKAVHDVDQPKGWVPW
ncbi:hypothetical protein E2562_000073 [Oryza meyeriana var. granulata]|uniref:Uncharacterized protein n=1 Tax=Oryza meyeriana var. granulata TaxID=110450 RepID=A0A6G1DC55_9ORYZ|nr:hypothetical protein E2562_000065 [Oryza meyeriana var. granulata]KAF0909744.1 hypothetical protein E2562_000073 [Oryza meyeriana var. granulata]